MRRLEQKLNKHYADDTSIACSTEDIEILRNNSKTGGKNFAEWKRQNKLILNTNKAEYMVIGQRRINHIQGLGKCGNKGRENSTSPGSKISWSHCQ